MQNLTEDFLQYLRHERGQSDNTARTYAALLGKFVTWAGGQGLADWKQVELKHLMAFLQHEQSRNLLPAGRTYPQAANGPGHSEDRLPGGAPRRNSARRLSSESVYLEIAALRAFYRFAENEKLLPLNPADNLSLPRRWQRLPKALTNTEVEKLLASEAPATPEILCDQAILELAYASGLRLSELKDLRLEQLHLESGFINVIGKGNKERVVPVGRKAVESLNRYLENGRPKLITPKSPAAVFLTKRGGCGTQYHAAHAAPQLRDSPAGTRRGSARDSGVARPRKHQHHGNLHARGRQPSARSSPKVSSAGLTASVGCAARQFVTKPGRAVRDTGSGQVRDLTGCTLLKRVIVTWTGGWMRSGTNSAGRPCRPVTPPRPGPIARHAKM